MSTKAERQKKAQVKAVAELAVKKLPKAQAETVKNFIIQFFADSPPGDLKGRTTEALFSAALSVWKSLQDRKPGKPLVRVHNPDAKQGDLWGTHHTILDIVLEDMPFLVDSVTAELDRLGLIVHLVLHPVIPVKRDEAGMLQEVYEEDEPFHDEKHRQETGVILESVMHLKVTRVSNASEMMDIVKAINAVLTDNTRAVKDWISMRRYVSRVAAEFDGPSPGVSGAQASEVETFLRWLHDDHFTFLGIIKVDVKTKGKKNIFAFDRSSALGLMRNKDQVVFDRLKDGEAVPPELEELLDAGRVLVINKANRKSTVHRAVYMDAVGVKFFNPDGSVGGYHLLVGLFTADVYTNSPNFVPFLKTRIDRLMSMAGFRKSSHDGKRLQNILENLPRDELFQTHDDQLFETAMGILHLQERQRVALFARIDQFERYASCLVYIPRDRFDTELRLKIADILVDQFNGRLSAYFTQVTDQPLARIQYIIGLNPGEVPKVDFAKVEKLIARAARDWIDMAGEALVAEFGERDGLALAKTYGPAFPASYRERFAVGTVLSDLPKIQAVQAGCGIEMQLGTAEDPDGVTRIHFKVFVADKPLPLSNVIPVLEDMGFHVRSEEPFRIEPSDGSGVVWIHNFGMTFTAGDLDIGAIRSAMHEAFAKVWSGEMESDGFNALVPSAGLQWRQVVVLRAYAKFLRQAAFPFSQEFIEQALLAQSELTAKLVEMFEAQFDPARNKAGKPNGAALAEKLKHDILAALEFVQSADEDRVVRRYLNLIDSTLRTNFYQQAENGGPKSYVSLKLNSQTIDDLPLPKPKKEIFVYSPRVEATHLRGGDVARGGLRWSDRREDFRSEILGLVKAQMVKNAVIVPTGSKGGFVVKQPPTDGGRDAFQAEGIACYQIMQRGLLDITDNLAGTRVKPPKNVVRRDGDDPYLVVAADKGTATFSDIANAISEDEYDHWLGDAYASGGTFGYDHKAMGITAKGAWESVKRHFREMGHNTQTQPFTVVGCGDMSGDVFGNGMLLSKKIRLVAAFNHMHIFVDPDPDPASSFKERQRLFKKARSSWTDYNTKLISKGGGIFERAAKSIRLTPEIKAALDLGKDTVTPNELITAILKAQVDLIWFGGIGTYIKSKAESDADAADRANDPIRINGEDVRARVIGEGANLGVTQLGRIEYAKAGGHINTDAIDNSAGVDCSDHEVNIKILLNGLVAGGAMTKKARNTLLEEMTDEVSDLVLRNNYLQTLAITLVENQAAAVLDGQNRMMRRLESEGLLNREIEFLPPEEEVAERQAAGLGLTRPEISVILPYGKMWLYEKLVSSDVPDHPLLEDDLIRYFPTPIQKKHKKEILGHKLRREIIATLITNSMINRVGASFMTRIMDRTGLSPVDVARAYMVTRSAYNLRSLCQEVEALDNKVDAAVQTDMLVEINRLVERSVLWLLRNEAVPMDMGVVIKRLEPCVQALGKSFDKVCSDEVRTYVETTARGYEDRGVPKTLARQIASIYRLGAANDVVRISASTKCATEKTAQIYFLVGQRFGLGALRQRTGFMARRTHWQELAISAAIEELFGHQASLTEAIARSCVKSKTSPDKALEAWVAQNQVNTDRVDALLAEITNTETLDLSMLTVFSRQLGSMR